MAKATTTKKATTAKKTTTAKPTAKKTTTVKKTTTAKPAAKKTTTAKPAAKKVAAPKAGGEISVTGNKKVGTLMKEFNKKFPYRVLGLSRSIARIYVRRGEPIDKIAHIEEDKTLAYWRRSYKEDEYVKNGSISISGNKKIKTLEKEFDEVFGLYCQICYIGKDGSRYYTSSSDDKTLASFNAECEKKGCKKGYWK